MFLFYEIPAVQVSLPYKATLRKFLLATFPETQIYIWFYQIIRIQFTLQIIYLLKLFWYLDLYPTVVLVHLCCTLLLIFLFHKPSDFLTHYKVIILEEYWNKIRHRIKQFQVIILLRIIHNLLITHKYWDSVKRKGSGSYTEPSKKSRKQTVSLTTEKDSSFY